jgi:iron complex outermembrane receptor protein
MVPCDVIWRRARLVHRRFISVVLMCSVATLLAAVTSAQTPTVRTISGVVVDESGGVVPAAAVTVFTDDEVVIGRTTTNSSGMFSLPVIGLGKYVVQVESRLFDVARIEAEVVEGRAPASIRAVLKVRGIEENVDVAASSRYAVSSAVTATKTDTPLLETPATIQTVSRALMDDRQATNVKDAVESIAGITPNASLGAEQGFIIRGFADNGLVFRNGLALNSVFATDVDTSTIERVEVLKGPASVLFGRVEPGGLINVVTKQPLARPAYEVEQQVGSWNTSRTLWDATGPVPGSSLLYRVAGGYQHGQSFRDFDKTNRLSVAPSLTWRPSSGTHVNVEGDGLFQQFIADYGIPVIGDRPANIPISRSFGDPNAPIDHLQRVNVATTVDQRLGGQWNLHHRFLYGSNHIDEEFVNPTPAFGNALGPDGKLQRNIFNQISDTHMYATNVDVVGDVLTAGIRHRVLIGVDYRAGFSDYQIHGNYKTPNPALAIDIFDPQPSYGIDPALFAAAAHVPASASGSYSKFLDTNAGVYVQDQATLWTRLHVLLGGRYDWASVGRGRSTSFDLAQQMLDASSPSVIRHDDQFSPRLGVVFQMPPSASVYSSWTTSFGANNGVTATGAAQPPQRARQLELGAKSEFLQDRATATASYFRLMRTNLLTPDLNSGDPNATIAIGEERSQGLELDLAGRLVRGLNVTATYAYMHATVVQDNSGLVGNRLVNTPTNAGTVWLTYAFSNPGPPLTFGIGMFTASDRRGDAENTFWLGSYVRTDATAAYRWRVGASRLTTQLSIRNLFDERYFESADPFSNVAPRLGVYPAAPRNASISLRVAF